MAINFPNSPSTGDTHVANNITWTYDGSSWRSNEGVGATVTVSDDPPSSPDSGDMWWESDTGKLKVYYNDGTSFQWVDASPQGSNEYVNLSVSGSLDAGGVNVTGVTTSVNVAVADSIGVGLYGQGTGIGITFESNGNATFSGIITAVAIQDPAGNSLGGGSGGASVTVSDNPPTSPTPSQGDLWWESDTGRLKIYYEDGTSNQWVDATPKDTLSEVLAFNGTTRVEANSSGAVVTGILTVSSDNSSEISGINVGMGGTFLPGTTTHDITNTAVGRAALYYSRPGGAEPLDGKYNTGVGFNVLGFGTGAQANVGVGAYALAGIGSTSIGVVAIGFNACYYNRGNNNTAVGTRTLQSNGKFDDVEFGPLASPGQDNTAVGSASLRDNIIGSWNSAIGAFSCGLQTSGSYNTAFGNSALYRNFSGSYGVAIGHNSQRWINDTTTPWNNYNTSVGSWALGFDSTNNTDSSGNTGNRNTAMGYGSLQNVTTGSRNTSLGMYCGQQITSAEDNTAVGYYTLEKLTNGTWGQNNTAVGGQALGLSTSSIHNTAIGYAALRNSNGKYNTSVGAWTLSVGTASTENTAIGYASQEQTTVEGQFNTSVGAFSLRFNTIAEKNIAIGGYTLNRSKASSRNTAVGYAAGANYNDSTTASVGANTFIGFAAGEGSTTPSSNTGILNTVVGAYSLQDMTSGEHNTTLGYVAGMDLTTGSYNTLLGAYTAADQIVTGSRNTLVGYLSGYKLKTGGYNVFVGQESGYENDDGQANTGLGFGALYYNRAKQGGTAVGYRSQYFVDSTDSEVWNYNTSLGAYALEGSNSAGSNTGEYNTAVGSYTMRSFTSGNRNTAIGSFAMNQTVTGEQNTANGVNALYNNTGGSYNTAIGYVALETNTTGQQNVAVGAYALQNANADGDYNTAVGYLCLRSANVAGNAYMTGLGYNAGNGAGNFAQQSTYIGAWSGQNSNHSNVTCLGYNSWSTQNNQVNLGNGSITSLRCNQTSISGVSDARDKKDVVDLPIGLQFINSLRPVKFVWDRRDGTMAGGIQEAGFIAQELDTAQSDAGAEEYMKLVSKDDPDRLEAAPGKLLPVLVKAIQELSAENTALKARLDAAGL